MRIASVLFFLALPLAAQPPIPRYEVKKTPHPIQIDGKLDDAEWRAAPPIELIFPWDFQTGAKQKTVVRLLWDDQYLYAGYDCDDKEITTVFTKRDDPTYRDDAVEIFINPKPSQIALYIGLEMNARAVLYDYLMYETKYTFKRFDLQGVKLASAVRSKGDGWSLEVAIPWENFEELSPRPTPGTMWTAALNRWDGTGSNRRLSTWSDPLLKTPSPHAPARFGQIVFVP